VKRLTTTEPLAQDIVLTLRRAMGVRVKYINHSAQKGHQGFTVACRQVCPPTWSNEFHVLGLPTQRWATWLCSTLLHIVFTQVEETDMDTIRSLELHKLLNLVKHLVFSETSIVRTKPLAASPA